VRGSAPEQVRILNCSSLFALNPMCRIRSTILFTIALMLFGTFSSALFAQFPAEVGVGARVRVWVPEAHRQSEGPAHRQMLRGTVAAVAPDTLHLSIPGAIGTVAIPRVAVRRLQVSRGWPSRPAVPSSGRWVARPAGRRRGPPSTTRVARGAALSDRLARSGSGRGLGSRNRRRDGAGIPARAVAPGAPAPVSERG